MRSSETRRGASDVLLKKNTQHWQNMTLHQCFNYRRFLCSILFCCACVSLKCVFLFILECDVGDMFLDSQSMCLMAGIQLHSSYL